MNHQRAIKIISKLCETDDFIKGKKLAEEVGVSVRTLQNEIAELRNMAESYNVNILAETGKGYLLIAKKENVERLLSFMDGDHLYNDFNHQDNRLRFILLSLLTSPLFYCFLINHGLCELCSPTEDKCPKP